MFPMRFLKQMTEKLVRLSFLVVLPAGNGGLEGGLQLHRRRVVHAVVRAEPRLLQGGGHGWRSGGGRGGGGAEEAAPRRGGGARPPALLLPERGVLQKSSSEAWIC